MVNSLEQGASETVISSFVSLQDELRELIMEIVVACCHDKLIGFSPFIVGVDI